MMLEFSSLSSSSPNAGRDVKNPEGTVLAKKTSIEKKEKKTTFSSAENILSW